MHYLRYLLKSFFYGLLVLFLFATIVFFGVQAILPGDFASQYALSLGSEGAEELRETLGLDLPVWQQYLMWLQNALRGDLGYTYSFSGRGQSVLSAIFSVLPSTLFVYGLGTILAFLVGNFLGKEIAFRNGKTPASVFIPLGILLYTSFPPWIVFLLMYTIRNIFFTGFWAPSLMVRNIPIGFPSGQLLTLFGLFLFIGALFWIFSRILQRQWKFRIPSLVILLLTVITWVGVWFLAGIDAYALEIVQKAYVPILAFTLLSFGEIMLITRTSVQQTMYEEYIQLARAKGLPPVQIRDRHAARTALLPIVSRMAISIPYLLSGMVMIEMSLNWPGIGTMLFFAVGMQNIPLMMGTILFNGILVLLIRLGLDMMLLILDPRIRISSQGKARL